VKSQLDLHILCLWGLILLVPQVVRSESDPDEFKLDEEEHLFELELEFLELEVESATLSKQAVEVAPSIIGVLTRDYFQIHGIWTLKEALKLMAGVTVLDMQDGRFQIAIRGIGNPANILVTLDGQPLNNFYDGTFYEDLPLVNIERIELVRGPGSALYGTNAFSGVISLYSRNPKIGLEGGISGEQLIDDEIGLGLSHHILGAYRLFDWDIGFCLQHSVTNGPKILVENDRSIEEPYTYVPGFTNDAREFWSVGLKIRREGLVVPEDRLDISSFFASRERGPFFGLQKVFTPNSVLSRELSMSFAEYQTPLGKGFSLRSRIAFDLQDIDHRIEQQPKGYFEDVDSDGAISANEIFPDGRLRRTRYRSNRLGFKLHAAHEIEELGPFLENHILVGFEFEYDWLPSFSYGQNDKDGYYQPGPLANHDNFPVVQLDKTRTVSAAFLQEQLHVVKSLWFTAGVRYDKYSDFGQTINPRVALVFQPLRQLSIKLLYGQAFRAPTFQELYDFTSFTSENYPIHGNRNIDPEKTSTVDVGIDATPFHWLNLRLSSFYVKTDQTIELSITYSFSGPSYLNFPGRQIWGVESEIQLVLDKKSFLAVNLTWFDVLQLGMGEERWEENNAKRFKEKELTDQPGLRANVVLSAEPLNNFSLGLVYSYIGRSSNNRRTTWEEWFLNFNRRAFHELSATVSVAMFEEKVTWWIGARVTVDKTIPVSFSANQQYSLPGVGAIVHSGITLIH
jgi:iron complex outermembrane receptor protein